MLRVADTIRNSWITDVINRLNAGSEGGKLLLYIDPQPEKGGATTTLLATLVFSNPCGSITDPGVFAFNPITRENNSPAEGKATWGRFVDSDGNFVADGTVGLTGSGADIILNSVDLTLGGIVELSSGALTAGNS